MLALLKEFEIRFYHTISDTSIVAVTCSGQIKNFRWDHSTVFTSKFEGKNKNPVKRMIRPKETQIVNVSEFLLIPTFSDEWHYMIFK